MTFDNWKDHGCAVCSANMGGMFEHTYPGNTDPTILCEDCFDAATTDDEGDDKMTTDKREIEKMIGFKNAMKEIEYFVTWIVQDKDDQTLSEHIDTVEWQYRVSKDALKTIVADPDSIEKDIAEAEAKADGYLAKWKAMRAIAQVKQRAGSEQLELKTKMKPVDHVQVGDVLVNGDHRLPVVSIHDGFKTIRRFTFSEKIGGTKADRTNSYTLGTEVEVLCFAK